MDEFEELLSQSCPAVERFVKFRLTSEQDAEDILQEVYNRISEIRTAPGQGLFQTMDNKHRPQQMQ